MLSQRLIGPVTITDNLNVKTIETTATVTPDGTLTAHVPGEVPPGEHRVLVLVDGGATDRPRERPRRGLNLPLHDVGQWPAKLSLRREDMYGDWGR